MAQGRYHHLPAELTGAPSPRPRPTVQSLQVRLIELNRQLDNLLLDRGIIGMARVRMFGTEFAADIVKDNGDGTYLMKARAHTARTAVGTQFTAAKGEVSLEASELPNDTGQQALESGMAAERATLETPESIISKHRQSLSESGTHSQGGVSVTPGPM
jgi:hypothetical protein